MFALLSTFALVTGASAGDATSLVQSRLTANDPWAGQGFASGPIEYDPWNQPEANQTGPPPAKIYKMIFQKTHGSDHACLTEMLFLDASRQPMQARLQEASSCYGCPVKCDECKAEWGDASRQFDMVHLDNEGSAWSCTNVGSFINAVGVSQPHVIFSLSKRPAKGFFQSAEVGEWTPKDWVLQEWQPLTGKWEQVAKVADGAKSEEVSFYIQYMGTAESPAKWPIDYEKCGGSSLHPIDVVPTIDPPTMSTSFTPLDGLFLAASGDFTFDSGHGTSIDGEFGSISVGTTVYNVKQVTFNFPSNRRGPDGNPAEGEMHIIMQKSGAKGIFDLATIAVLLQLKEEGAPNDPTREFFLNLGLERLPPLSEPNPINGTVDLNAFKSLIEAGSVMVPSCSTYVTWYVLGEPAWITGSIMQSFLDGPTKTPAPTFFNQTIVNMTEEEKVAAYFAAGMNPDGSPLMSEEQRAIIAAGPTVARAQLSMGPAPPDQTAETGPGATVEDGTIVGTPSL